MCCLLCANGARTLMVHFHYRASLGLVRYSQALVSQAHFMLRFYYSLVAGAVTIVTQCRRSREVIFNENQKTNISRQLLALRATKTKVKQVQTTDCLCHGEFIRWFIYCMSVQAVVVSRSIYYVSLADLHSENTHFKRFFACRLSADLSKHSFMVFTNRYQYVVTSASF